jgi:putative oxidoreductase
MQPVIQRVSRFFYNRSIGLLFLRVSAGAIFLVHGWQKVADMSTAIGFFDSLGFSPLIAVLIAWLEIVGGAALILGIAPRIFAAVLGVEMLVAALIVIGYGTGVVSAEFELLLAAVSFGIMFLGSGRFAIYKMECDACNGLLCIRKNRVCVMPA